MDFIQFVGALIAFAVVILGGVKFMLIDVQNEIRDVWKRLNSHYHEVECSNDACRKLTTGNVIIPRGAE